MPRLAGSFLTRIRSARALWIGAVGCALVTGCARPNLRAAPPALRVMTYNIRSGNGDLDGTAAAIRALAPDIVALQEVDVHWASRSGFADQAMLLGQKLRMRVCFARIYELPPERDGLPLREFGVALLTRHPMTGCANRVITRLSTQEKGPVPAPMPGFLEATVEWRGTSVRVFDTHLDYRSDPAVRRRQVEDMLGFIGAARSPTILMGDLNAEPNASEIQPLFASLRDAWLVREGSRAEDRPGPTYPAEDPKKRIDYVLVSKDFRVISVSVPATLASDHRPVVADLVLIDRKKDAIR